MNHLPENTTKRFVGIKGLFAIVLSLVSFSLFAQTSRIDSLKKDAIRLQGDTGLVWTYIRLGLNYQSIDYDSSLYYLRLSNLAARKTHFEKGITSTHTRLGNVFRLLSEYDSALFHYKTALDYYIQNDDSINQAKLYNNLGLISQDKGDYSTSIKYYLKALKIKESLGDKVAMASTSHNIGIVFAFQQDYKKAEKYMTEAMDFLVESGDSLRFYIVVLDYSQLLYELGEQDQALLWINRSLHYFKSIGFTQGIARSEVSKGMILSIQGNYNEALKHFHVARKLYVGIGDRNWEATCDLNLSKAFYKQGLYDSSIFYGDTALFLALEIGVKGMISDSYNQLAMSNAAIGSYEKAYFFKEKHQTYRDSLKDEEKQRVILEYEGKYNEEKQQRIIDELQLNKAREDLINYILIGILVILLGLGVLFWFQYRIKQRRNILLQEKNQIIQNSLQEKEVLLREIHHRVQNNLQFVSSLINLQSRHINDKKTVQLLKECRTRIQSMAMIHQKLYQEKSLKGINIENYVHNLIQTISESYNVNKDQIDVKTDIDPIELDINTAIPIGLILNELITNAFKYAFERRETGRLLIRLKHQGSELHLTVQDDGVGLPDNFNPDSSSSFGMKLVNSLANKLKASIDIIGGIGTTIQIKITQFEIV